MVSEQLHYTTNREEIFIFSNKKMSYLCGVWRFANAYYEVKVKGAQQWMNQRRKIDMRLQKSL